MNDDAEDVAVMTFTDPARCCLLALTVGGDGRGDIKTTTPSPLSTEPLASYVALLLACLDRKIVSRLPMGTWLRSLKDQSFILLVAPVAKQRPRVVRQGAFTRTYTPVKTVSAENAIRAALYEQKGRCYPPKVPLVVNLSFHVVRPKSTPRTVPYPTTKPGDIENLAKTVLDAGNGILWADDSQIVTLTAQKHYASDGVAKIEIRVGEV